MTRCGPSQPPSAEEAAEGEGEGVPRVPRLGTAELKAGG